MKHLIPFLLIFSLFLLACEEEGPAPGSYDICIYGGTSAGVIAAYSAAKLGKKVLLIEPGTRLGGLSSGGLGQTDIGNKYAVTGISRDFYRKIGQHYGEFEQWTFEPHVAAKIFKEYIGKAGIEVLYQHRIIDAEKLGADLRSITLENTDPNASTTVPYTVKAAVFIDCSYEGDLMALAAVSYTVGREENAQYGETYNGVQLREYHQFPDGIDPYKMPGDSASGLLWGISADTLAKPGSGDTLVQAYNFRICLTRDPANRIPITQPEAYEPEKYELLLRVMEARPWKTLDDGFIWSLMPNNKTDINNRGAFSSDMIGWSHEYPEADYERREEIVKEHVAYTKGLLYFLGNDPRVADTIRTQMKQWGYPKDEYENSGNFTPQLYIREARRLIGEYVMTEANCTGKKTVPDAIGMAAYTMDSHNCQRIVVWKGGKAMVKNEGDVQIGGFPPYPISYRSLTPKREECTNLLVPVCLSASHIAYGSIRMEPVFMVLAQSAAIAASLAIDEDLFVQEVPVAKVQEILKDNPLLDGSTPEILVDNSDTSRVKYAGLWAVQKEHWDSKSNGADHLLLDKTATDSSRVRFTPEIKKPGMYAVWYYCPGLYGEDENGRKPYEKIVEQLPVVIHHRGGETPFALNYKENIRKWARLGQYDFGGGDSAWVEVMGDSLSGQAGADAVLFVPVR
ncbi:MAG: FAD-dependent oxidoreductase [Bacteroidia bacterium]|nr:FAD-dependent oxidoreductase [Bacteroidia bacterium]